MFTNNAPTILREVIVLVIHVVHSSSPSWPMNVHVHVANTEQFTIVLRGVPEDLQVNESFIGLYQVGSIDCNSLVFCN